MKTVLLGLALTAACSSASSPYAGPVRPDPTPITVPSFTSSLDSFFDDVASRELLVQATGAGGRTERPLLQVGPQHCDAQDSLWLNVRGGEREASRPYGYLRDPDGTVLSFTKGTYAAHAVLPATARPTGWVLGSAELWLGDDEATAGYLVNAGDRSDVERWPALAGLCA